MERRIYELRNVAKHFRQGDVTIKAVDDIDLVVEAGELVVIEGPSGSGKSTLLQLLGGLDRATSGQVLLDSTDIGTLNDKRLANVRLNVVGFVFQHFNLIPTMSASENVEAALAPRKLPKTARRERVAELLELVGLSDRAEHLPSQLSGGQQQRVAIARALANEPQVILADEPTGNLDSATSAEVMDLLIGLSADRKQTVVVITHDAVVAERAPRLIRMRDGKLDELTRVDPAVFAPGGEEEPA
jgi:putative ABC transport system ATP-binding protein